MYAVTIYAAVDDAEQLHAEAVRRARADGLSQESIDETLGTSNDIRIDECLRYVIDPGVPPPGTSIEDSTCESNCAFERTAERG